MSALNGNGGDLKFEPKALHPNTGRAGTRQPRPPMPVVCDADLLAPQRLPALRGFWWKPRDWRRNGDGIYVATFDPLTSNAAAMLETVFGRMHGWPKPASPQACVEDFAREFGGRAAKSLRWRYQLPVAEQALVSSYREFLTRHLLNRSHEGEAAPVLDMQDFRLRQAREARAAAEAERARIAAVR